MLWSFVIYITFDIFILTYFTYVCALFELKKNVLIVLLLLSLMNVWFHEEPLASLEPFHSTRGSFKRKRFLDYYNLLQTQKNYLF